MRPVRKPIRLSPLLLEQLYCFFDLFLERAKRLVR